ncbi:MAG TPA: hypothetical protein VKE74_09490 [Gemmataceae bacterium]|nr:hypothetical protein [Gemmataceae bacterium]
MPRKLQKTGTPLARSRALRPLVAVGFTLGVVAALLFGLGWLGDEARKRLGPHDRYRVRFADIDCDAPPGIDRPTFLSEVRYIGDLPDTFQILDPDLGAKLTAAFAAHPWVESVDGVDVEPPGRVRVRLRFRTPVLLVRLAGGGRLVDGNGVLLPLSDVPPGLAELASLVPPPQSPAGRPWDDATVRRAVELEKTYRPRQLEKTPTGWRLTGADGKVLHIADAPPSPRE